MRRLSLRALAAFTVPALFMAPAALAQYAGADDVPAAIALFSDENFYGDVRDVYDPFVTLSDLAFNDRPRSVAVFAGQWELCEHKDFTGRCVFIQEDVSDLGWFGLAGRVTSVRPVYEYTEASHGLMFTRDKYGYIRYAHNESYGYDTWNYGYASSWGISVSHYGYSPDYYRYGYYSPTWGYDPYGFAWGPRGTIRYTTSYRRHPRPSVINPYWSGWDRRPSDWRHGHWSWRDGRRGDNWRDWPRGGRDGRGDGHGDRDGRDGRGDRDGRGGWDRDGRGGRDGRGDRDDRPPGRDVPGDRWGPGAGGSGSDTAGRIPTDPRTGRGGRDGRGGDGRGDRGGRGDRDGRSRTPDVGTTAVVPRDPRPGRETRGGGGGRTPVAGIGTSIVTPPVVAPRETRPGRDTRGGRGDGGAGLLGGPGADGRGSDRPRGGEGRVRGGGDDRRGGGRAPGGDSGSGRGAPFTAPAVSSPPPPPPPRETRRETRSDTPRVDRPRGGDGARNGDGGRGRVGGGDRGRRDND